ncbi:7SK snRNA methylphosphate capping enzyme-like [Oppia nitens]|uniref:7SK snRNA methylphosphate capping enzyme-like n=1 Tax=Oppia nitens TaxID=1686743 RepID=UPI0023DA1434|nr:7SK snRNA methylphosphate capping enzyme-like [Oppia nitens]
MSSGGITCVAASPRISDHPLDSSGGGIGGGGGGYKSPKILSDNQKRFKDNNHCGDGQQQQQQHRMARGLREWSLNNTKRCHTISFKTSEQSRKRSGSDNNNYRKRRYSSGAANNSDQRFLAAKRRKDRIILPTRFLLGGNISDPLNLSSLADGANQLTPQSSPMPTPRHKTTQVEVLIPANINDPLNLITNDEISLISPKIKCKSRKHKNKRKRTESESTTTTGSSGGGETTTTAAVVVVEPTVKSIDGIEQSLSLTSDLLDQQKTNKLDINTTSKSPKVLKLAADSLMTTTTTTTTKSISDKIVSPVIPQGISCSKHRRIHNNNVAVGGSGVDITATIKPSTSSEQTINETTKDNTTTNNNNNNNQRVKYKKFNKNQQKKFDSPKKFRSKDLAFRYGNYNQYYGYRNAVHNDLRLNCLKKDWFHNKDVLDIGCNVGHITLMIAKNFEPKSIVGLDIDSQLIRIANKNIRHYITSSVVQSDDFPISLPLIHGPLAMSSAGNNNNDVSFPKNVRFISGNYISETDNWSSPQHQRQQQFDTILCLSLTKWIHLNWGDQGVRQLFKRIFGQLRPNGRLILEAQPFCSYKKKKKINETTLENFNAIQFKPEQFNEYLLSREVGFSQSELIGTPENASKGFRRSIYVFTKSGVVSSSSTTTSSSTSQSLSSAVDNPTNK